MNRQPGLRDPESIRSSCGPYLALFGLAESHDFSQGSGSSAETPGLLLRHGDVEIDGVPTNRAQVVPLSYARQVRE